MSDDFDLLAGSDEPRPLPADLRQRIESALLAGNLAGIDAPRPVPPHLRARLERALVARRPPFRAIATAAALLLVLATVIAATRNGPGGEGEVAANRPARTGTTVAGDAGAAAPTEQPAFEAAAPAQTAPTTVGTRAAAAPTPTTAPAAPAAAGGSERRDAVAGAAAAQSAPAPSVTVEPSTARRGEEVTGRASSFSTATIRYTLIAPSGRTVFEQEAGAELRFTVGLTDETGRYTLVAESADRSQRAEAYLDVVVA